MKFKSRRLKKQNLFSIFLTTGIVFMLLFSGPVAGVQVGVTNISDTTPNEATNVTFQVYADITYNNERIALTSLTLNLTNTGGLSNYTCTFDALAHNLTACTNVTILMINNGSTGYDYGYQWGYGYGYLYSNGSIGTYNTTFGYGYGYGYQSGYSYDAATGAELLYNITWLTPAVTSNTNYTISVGAETSNNGTQVRYLNTSSTLLEVQNVASSETPSSSGGGTSTGTGAAAADKVTEYKESKAWDKISAGTETVMTIKDENIGVRKVLFTLTRDISDVTMDVIAYSERPTKIPAFTGGTIFQYLEIVTNLVEGDVSSATLDFRVTKAWFSLNNIGYDDVALYRYKGDWTELPTTRTSDDATYVYYAATSPGFSYFAIGQKVVPTQPSEGEAEAEAEAEKTETPPTVEPTGEAKKPQTEQPGTTASLAWLWWMIVIVLVVAGAAYYYFTYYKPKSKA